MTFEAKHDDSVVIINLIDNFYNIIEYFYRLVFVYYVSFLAVVCNLMRTNIKNGGLSLQI